MSGVRSFRVVGAAVLACALLFTFAPGAGALGNDRTPPTKPTNLRITASTDTSVSLAWNKSTDNSTNFWYCVQTNGGGCIRVNPPQTTILRTNLLPNKTHTFSVYAVDAAGNRSANSNTVSYTTPPDLTPPSPKPNLTVTELFPTRVSVTWPNPVDGVSPQVWTSLFVNGSPYFVDRLGPPGATVTNLTPGQTYQLRVTVRDASGNVNSGDTLAVTMPAVVDTVPPSVPTNLQLGSESFDNEIWLRWTESTDNFDAQANIRYDVYLNGVRAFPGQAGGRTIVTCLSAGPTAIHITAVDTSGNASGISNTVSFNCTV
jgi:chitodextrinase